MKVLSFDNYNRVKKLCKDVKEGNVSAFDLAASLLASMVSEDDILVPIPGRFGRATYTLSLAVRIAYKTGCKVCNCLRGEIRDSLCDLKQDGKKIQAPEFQRAFKIPKGRYILVDNVYDTGLTASAASKALKRKCDILVIGKTTDSAKWKRKKTNTKIMSLT